MYEDGETLQGVADLVQVPRQLHLFLVADFADVGEGRVGGALIQLVRHHRLVHRAIVVLCARVCHQERLASGRQIVGTVTRKVKACHHLFHSGRHDRTVHIRRETPAGADPGQLLL